MTQFFILDKIGLIEYHGFIEVTHRPNFHIVFYSQHLEP